MLDRQDQNQVVNITNCLVNVLEKAEKNNTEIAKQLNQGTFLIKVLSAQIKVKEDVITSLTNQLVMHRRVSDATRACITPLEGDIKSLLAILSTKMNPTEFAQAMTVLKSSCGVSEAEAQIGIMKKAEKSVADEMIQALETKEENVNQNNICK